jgi:hypothetical protein
MRQLNINVNPNKIRIIKTAWDIKSINKAAKEGFRPLLKLAEIHHSSKRYWSAHQNKITGEVVILKKDKDYEKFNRENSEPSNYISKLVCISNDLSHIKLSCAAYLIPPDIIIGEEVRIEDVIYSEIERSIRLGYLVGNEMFFVGGQIKTNAIWDGNDLIFDMDDAINHTPK